MLKNWDIFMVMGTAIFDLFGNEKEGYRMKFSSLTWVCRFILILEN